MEKYITFTEDEKAVLLKNLNGLHSTSAQLYNWVNSEELAEEMAVAVASLLESYFYETAKTLNYESHLTKEKEERHAKIIRANNEIRELKAKLGSSKPVDGMAEQIKYLSETVSEWWRTEGFNHVSDIKFQPYGGYRARFCFMPESRSSFTQTPVTDKRNTEQHIQYLKELGFKFNDSAKDRYDKLHLLDTGKNKALLLEMLKRRFPSIVVHSWNIWNEFGKDVYFIRDFEASIYNLADIVESEE